MSSFFLFVLVTLCQLCSWITSSEAWGPGVEFPLIVYLSTVCIFQPQLIFIVTWYYQRLKGEIKNLFPRLASILRSVSKVHTAFQIVLCGPLGHQSGFQLKQRLFYKRLGFSSNSFGNSLLFFFPLFYGQPQRLHMDNHRARHWV